MYMIVKGIHKQEVSALHEYSPAQKHVLMALGKKDKMGVKQLADLLLVTSGAATQHIDGLEKMGLLTREINSANRREVFIRLSNKGLKAYKEIHLAHSRLLNKVFGQLSDDELDDFVALIEKVSHKYIIDKKG
jgi:DNA-binding MarR family transcriptional regulator